MRDFILYYFSGPNLTFKLSDKAKQTTQTAIDQPRENKTILGCEAGHPASSDRVV